MDNLTLAIAGVLVAVAWLVGYATGWAKRTPRCDGWLSQESWFTEANLPPELSLPRDVQCDRWLGHEGQHHYSEPTQPVYKVLM